ncbi:patatin-like phospholipase family protein [Paenibacillus gansuensis]|uniref:patatin-like phospholipase family protein n=1 Tax=Paenibacillus gansuensis TaxID=306542 RepID=UPI00366F1A00
MIGLALSGGGYRASLFHLGVMARLADEGELKNVQALSTVSGGSIVGAFYYKLLCEELQKDRILSEEDYRWLMKRVISEFVAVVQEDLRDRILITGGISRLVPEAILKRLAGAVSKVVPALNPAVLFDSKLEQGMRALMFQHTVLSDLMVPPVHPGNVKPELIMNTSILENGQPLFLSTNTSSVLWRYNETNHGLSAEEARHLPLSKAAAASACVPGLFDPIAIPFGDRMVHGVDGGVLDNLGGHAIQLIKQEGMSVLVSDASKPLRLENYSDVDSVESFLRIQDLFMNAIRDLRVEGANETLVDMQKDIEGINSQVRTLAMNMRTDLNSFTEVEAYSLMYIGYCACGQEMSKWKGASTLEAKTEQVAGGNWPFMSVRSFAEAPVPEYLALLGEKSKKRHLLSNMTISRFISLGYLLLYAAVFSYIGIHHGFYEALWYVGLIPVVIISVGGALFIRRRVASGKRKGTVASLFSEYPQ